MQNIHETSGMCCRKQSQAKTRHSWARISLQQEMIPAVEMSHLANKDSTIPQVLPKEKLSGHHCSPSEEKDPPGAGGSITPGSGDKKWAQVVSADTGG